MTRIVVLGAGMVGRTIALDFVADPAFSVLLADRSADTLDSARQRLRALTGRDVETTEADLAKPDAIVTLIDSADLVMGALPSSLGLSALRTVIDARKPYCDISFMAEDPASLHDLAIERGVTAVVDCGVAPGLSNMLVGRGVAEAEHIISATILVGGLPRERRWPFEYKAGFSPMDVLEEYTRPARQKEHGCIVEHPALSGRERIGFDGLGTLEAFHTDGLRSLLTLDVPTMTEKTLRYPGHAALMEAFRETGLFDETPIDVDGCAVIPRRLLSALLFPKWTFAPDEHDVTVLRVEVRTGDEGRRWEMIDRFDPATGLTSMSRTTAYPAAIVGRMILDGTLDSPGVIFPESIGRTPEHFAHIEQELARRGIKITESTMPDERAAL